MCFISYNEVEYFEKFMELHPDILDTILDAFEEDKKEGLRQISEYTHTNQCNVGMLNHKRFLTRKLNERNENKQKKTVVVLYMLNKVYNFNGKVATNVQENGSQMTVFLDPLDAAFINIYEFIHLSKVFLNDNGLTLIDDGSGDVALYLRGPGDSVKLLFQVVSSGTYRDNIISAFEVALKHI